MKLDLRDFQKRLLAKRGLVKVDAATEINRAAKQLGILMTRALRAVPQSQIRAELNSNQKRLAALASIRLKRKGVGILKAPLFRRAMRRYVSFKAKSSGYMRSPFRFIVEQMGGAHAKRFLGVDAKVIPATARRLKCDIGFTMSFETSAKRKSAEARMRRDLQPILNGIVTGIKARNVLKGWSHG